MNLKNLKTKNKLIFSFSSIVLLVIAVTGIGVWSLTDVNGKHNNLEVIKQTRADLLSARLYMRTFVHLRDTQYFEISLKSINTAISAIEKLKAQLTIKDNKELADQYLNRLNEYKSLMLVNRNAIVAQTNSIDLRAKVRNEIKAEFQISGLPEHHKMNYYFTNARLTGTYIYALNKPEYFEEYKNFIGLTIQEAGSLHLKEVILLLTSYNQAMEDFMSAYKTSKETELKLVDKGKEIVAIADHMEENILEYVNMAYKGALSMMFIGALLSVVISIIITYVLTKYITSMLKKGVALAQTFADGNLTFRVPQEDLVIKDEMGDLARAMVTMGDKIKEVIEGVLTSAENVVSASFQISSTSQQISQGASEQASSVEEVSSSMEQMSSNIQQNAENSQHAEAIAQTASKGIAVVAEKAQKAMEANRIIAEKINIINDIAFQTNILALNAAVEAARAGEQGRGFAVVAAEVRKLAERSKIAADEIVTLSKTSLDLVETTAIQMGKIIPDIERTSKLVVEITASSNEQSSGSDQINNALQQLNNVTQQNAAASEELATSAEEMTSQAEMMKEQVSYFKTGNHVKTGEKKLHSKTAALSGQTKKTSEKASPRNHNGISLRLLETKNEDYDSF